MIDLRQLKIRKGTADDVPAVLSLIRELAHYERAGDQVTVTEKELLADGFGPVPLFEMIVAVWNDEVVGMAFYYPRYSTWKGRTIHLEDFIVKQEYRQYGIGQLLWDEIIRQAAQFGAKRLEWVVLEWNEPAIRFYQKQKATLDGEWYLGQLSEEQIQKKVK